jgi:flagellar biogenesis protein FliO
MKPGILSSLPMKFDPDHLRIAAEVRAKAQRRRWFDRVGGMLALLIMVVSLVWITVLLARIAYLVL